MLENKHSGYTGYMDSDLMKVTRDIMPNNSHGCWLTKTKSRQNTEVRELPFYSVSRTNRFWVETERMVPLHFLRLTANDTVRHWDNPS